MDTTLKRLPELTLSLVAPATSGGPSRSPRLRVNAGLRRGEQPQLELAQLIWHREVLPPDLLVGPGQIVVDDAAGLENVG